MTENSNHIDNKKKVAILVLGMHRSGTSALTRVINLLGADLPCNLAVGGSDNKTGHWESRDIFGLNDKILSSVGGNWHAVHLKTLDNIEPSQYLHFKNAAITLLKRDFTDSNFFVLKDPRICLLLPFWLDVIDAVGAQPKCVFITRNPIEVAASLKKRDHFNEAKSKFLWLQHVLEAENKTRNISRVFISYKEVLNDWRLALSKTAEQLQLTWPSWSPTSEEKIDLFLDPRHMHHSTKDNSIFELPEIEKWIKNTYSSLTTLQIEPQNSLQLDILDQIHLELLSADELIGSHLQSLENSVPLQEAKYHNLSQSYNALEQDLSEKQNTISELTIQNNEKQRQIENLRSQNNEKHNQIYALASDHKTLKNRNQHLIKTRMAALLQLNSYQTSILVNFFKLVLKLESKRPVLVKTIASIPQCIWWGITFTLPQKMRMRQLANEFTSSGLFNLKWYIEHNPDVILHGANPIFHWLMTGWKEGRAPNPYFDPSWYFSQLPDIKGNNINPLVHYCSIGFKQGLHPSPLFSTTLYFIENNGPHEAGANPLAHYLTVGQKTGYKAYPINHKKKTNLESTPKGLSV